MASPSLLVLLSYTRTQKESSSTRQIRLTRVTNIRTDAHKSWMVKGSLALCDFAEAISIACTSLQQRHSISLASFLQCPHFRSSRPELFCKRGVLKNFVIFTCDFAGTSVSCKFCEILRNTFFYRIPPIAVSGIGTN